MKTLQNGVLMFNPRSDGKGWCWLFEHEDGSVLLFREANIVSGPDLVYRASREGTVTPLKSTVRKNKDHPEIVVSYLPGEKEIRLQDYILGSAVGWDYVHDVPVTKVELDCM